MLISLQTDELFFYNEPWTEYDRKQQIGRVYRPGHEGDLTVRTFVAEGTIEEGIHRYIKAKYIAIEKILRGIPPSEIERELLRQDEKQKGPNLEVNPELAKYYFSSWGRMMKIYTHVKEQGEESFKKFLVEHGETYAEGYRDMGSRSYEANANRLAGGLIASFARQSRRKPESLRIVDLASGPEMLRRHMPDTYSDCVTSVDLNPHHFETQDEKRIVASFRDLPIQEKSVDYVNLALALHYTRFRPSQGEYERVEVFQEMNRILKPGGRAIISLMYSLDIKDLKAFRTAVGKLGFKVVGESSGLVEAENTFRSRVLTLEKIADCPSDTSALVRGPGSAAQGFKFRKDERWVKDQRRIVTRFGFAEAGRTVNLKLNSRDREVHREERGAIDKMEQLRDQFRGVEAIPASRITKTGLARVFTGRRWVLFKRLQKSPGAVVVR